MPIEYSLKDFRKVSKLGRTSKANGFLSGSRLIKAVVVHWTSKAGKHKLHYDRGKGKNHDYIKECFEELQKNCIIRDCLMPAQKTLAKYQTT